MKYSEIVLIDDVAVNNMMSKALLRQYNIAEEIIEFTEASDALDYFSSEEKELDKNRLIFLDINMPNMNGWQFLERLSQFAAKELFNVVMLSSSVSKVDKEKAKDFNIVSGFISKPLTLEAISSVF